MMSPTRPTDESLMERRIARQRECIAQVQTHIEGLLSSSPDVRGAKLLQAEMIREIARLRAVLLSCRLRDYPFHTSTSRCTRLTLGLARG